MEHKNSAVFHLYICNLSILYKTSLKGNYYAPIFAAMKGSALKRFRQIAVLEGISYLLLLFIAMPLKYFADMPLAVKYTGWVHGLLFVLYAGMLIQVWQQYNWKFGKAVLVFVASLLPFAPFYVDKKLKEEQ